MVIYSFKKLFMLQIPPHHLIENKIKYSQLAGHYLPEEHYSFIIPKPKQQNILQILDEWVDIEHFYFIVDVKRQEIINSNGIENCLEYQNKHFSLKNYLSIIHPAHSFIQTLNATVLFDILMNKHLMLSLSEPYFTSSIALKHRSGKYYYFKRECSPFQLSTDEKMTEYLFTIEKEWEMNTVREDWVNYNLNLESLY